jgi:PadR family transcriptional regulator PadR
MAGIIRLTKTVVTLLMALSEDRSEWKFGYAISRATGMNSGTLYPILARLSEAKWLESRWQPSEDGRPPRRLHRLTALGAREARALLTSQRARKHSSMVTGRAYGNAR